jgi:hypothetical protein
MAEAKGHSTNEKNVRSVAGRLRVQIKFPARRIAAVAADRADLD